MTSFRAMLRPEIGSLHAYHPAHAPPDAVRLDANESPHTLPDEARRHLADALARVDVNRYPDVRAIRLRERIAEREGVHPDQLVIGCGSDEVIALLVHALCMPPEGRERASVLYPEPTFVMYRITATGSGIEPVGVPLDASWDLDVPAFERAIDAHRPNIVFVPSPNNPTANLFDDARIASVIAAARDHSLVVLDEAYGAFAGRTYRALREAHAHVAQLQTLSKIGLAAARVGWAILPAELALEVEKIRQPYNLNTLSQRAAELALTDLAPYFAASVARIVEERTRLADALRAKGFVVHRSDANFLWVDAGRDAADLYRHLYDRGVIVRSFHTAGGRMQRHVRITVGTRDENDRLLAAIA